MRKLKIQGRQKEASIIRSMRALVERFEGTDIDETGGYYESDPFMRTYRQRGYNTPMIPEVLATLASGTFFGAALYVSLVEQPARVSCGVRLAVTEWRPSYKRGTWMQAPLALIGSVSGLTAWWFQGSAAWLAGGLFLSLVIAFTLIVILPTNKQLESQALDIHSEEAMLLLKRWGWLHAIRTILGGVAFLLFLSVLIAKR